MINQDIVAYIRQLTENDSKTLSQKALKASEEVCELAKCVCHLTMLRAPFIDL